MLERKGGECRRNGRMGMGSSRQIAARSRDRGKPLLKVGSLGIITHKCYGVHTWHRVVVVDEVRGTTEEFCQFAGTPQELLALMRGERVRGGRGLGKGDDRAGHCRLAVEKRRDGELAVYALCVGSYGR